MSTPAVQDPGFLKAVYFIQSIGIEVKFEPLGWNPPMPGICIKNGAIFIDREAYLYAGDILHEAGHIAVVALAERSSLENETIAKRPNAPAEEMMALAWSYAACLHLGLPAEFVFHENGYKNEGQWLAETFKSGSYIGLPMLQFKGLCHHGFEVDMPQFPVMKKWVVD